MTSDDVDRWIDHLIEDDRKPIEVTEDLTNRFIIVLDNSEKFNHAEFANWIIEESGMYFATTRDDTIYIYVDGIYKPNGHTYIKTEMDRIMKGELLTPYMENAVIAKVRARTYVEREVFDEGEDVINMNNGLYNIKTCEFSKHSHTYMSLSKSAVNYDPAAKCPNFDKFIDEVVEHHRIQTVYEMGGYALMRRKRVKRGFILLGKSDTGKTQLMNFWIAFIGEDGSAAVNPIHLTRDSHAGSGVYGKHLNIVDDLGDAPIAETGILKSMIGDGMLTCNAKNKPAFPFRPYVMNVWGCNVLPKTTDPYFGDKFDILKFKNVFGGHPTPDRKLIDKITTPEELSGYFNKAVEAFRYVMDCGEFTGSTSQVDRQREWLEESTPVAKYVNERCVIDNDTLTLVTSFHKGYDLWIKSNGYKREKNKDIVSYLESIGVYKTTIWKRSDENYNRRAYLGVRILLKDELPSKTQTRQNILEGRQNAGTVPDYVPLPSIINPIPDQTIGTITCRSGNGENNGRQAQKPVAAGTKTNDSFRKAENVVLEGSSQTASKKTNMSNDIEGKLKYAFGKLSTSPNIDGWSVEEITEAYPQITTQSYINDLMETYGLSIGFKRAPQGWRV